MIRKLNNKGFAITGILYTLFILFILILVSILGGLQTKKQMLEKNTEKLEESYKGTDVTNDSNVGIEKAFSEKKALVKGKYVFELDSNGTKVSCYSYLNKGDILEKGSIKFTPKDCNDYNYTFNNENNSAEGITMTLKNIYSFESE